MGPRFNKFSSSGVLDEAGRSEMIILGENRAASVMDLDYRHVGMHVRTAFRRLRADAPWIL